MKFPPVSQLAPSGGICLPSARPAIACVHRVTTPAPMDEPPDSTDSRIRSSAPRPASERLRDSLESFVGDLEEALPDQAIKSPVDHSEGDATLAKLRAVVDSLMSRNETLEAQAGEAHDALAQRESFMARVSHEIRTPMNGILGMANLLLDDPEVNSTGRDYVETIRNSTHALLNILNEILDFSRLCSDEIELEMREFDPHRLVGDVQRTFAASAQEKKAELTLGIEESVPEEALGDDCRIRQVLCNLVSNAIKFTEDGEIRIQVAARGQILQFDVMDSGVGIPQEAIPRLFEPFTQTDSSTSRIFGGTGLGLAICKSIVERMGGEIRVESLLGRGSCFSFIIPFSVPDRTSAEREEPAEAPSHAPRQDASPFGPEPEREALTTRRVLLVEDDPINRKVASLTMQRLGCFVDTASDGYEAIRMVQLADYDVICMDLTMPGLSGIETTQHIRDLDCPASGARIVALTGHAFEEDRERCRKAGMDGFLTKPMDISDLRRELSCTESPALAS